MEFNSMITKGEVEKLFLYCLEELRLLIEKPYENYALVERLSNVKDKLETLYRELLIEKREIYQGNPLRMGDKTFYSVPELAHKLNVTTVTIRNYLKQGKLKGRKVMGKWFISDENLFEIFKN